MKKNFMYFALALLSVLVLGGGLKSWAAVPEPTNKLDPNTVFNLDNDVVTFKVIAWDGELGAYKVQIVGVDYDYVQTPPENLTVKTVFQWKRGKELVNFYVTSIAATNDEERGSFWAQTNLKKVEFVNDGAIIGNDKFQITIGANAFNGCTNLETLTLPDNVVSIGEYAFRSSAIKNFVIPAECSTIGQFAFDNTRSLQTVTVSQGKKDSDGEQMGNIVLGTISQKVFANSYVHVLDLSMARALTTIEDDAFIYSESEVNNQLTKVILPDGIYNSVTKKVVKGGPTTFVSLGTKGTAFRFCTALESIGNTEISIIPLINNGAFEGCESLKELYLPKTADIAASSTSLKSAFLGCKSLETLKFADGWNQNIGSDIYASKDLSEDEQKAEKSYLKSVTFVGSINGTGSVGNPGEATIAENAFLDCTGLATLTFTKGFVADGTVSTNNITIGVNAFKGTALTSVKFNGFTFGAASLGGAITINPGAFACDELADVTFGKIAYSSTSENQTFELKNKVFVSDKLKDVTFGDITAADETHSILTIGNGTNPVVVKKTSDGIDALETVTFGKLTAGAFTIGTYAFQSEVLKSVVFKDITTVDKDKAGSLTIGDAAFLSVSSVSGPGNTNEKTVEIGNIGSFKKDDIFQTLTVAFGTNAFAGTKLKSVTVKNLTDGANVTCNAGSFANSTGDTEKFSAMAETVTIGKIEKSATVDVKAGAFTAPQRKNSEFVVKIATGDKENIAGTVNAEAGAFNAPSVGTTKYTLGNIASTADLGGLADDSFVGSTDGEVPVATNTTSVTLGEVEAGLSSAPFTNVYDATVGKWAKTANLDFAVFKGVVEATIGDIVKDASISGIYDPAKKLESLEFTGNVAGDIKTFNSPKVRSIKFTSEDPEVKKHAFTSGSFQAAGADAATAIDNEQIVVVYKTRTSAKSSAIFAVDAFGTTADDKQSVTLYTDEWTKVNIFQNKSIYKSGEPFRLSLSASDVVPGQDITATCYTHTGGKYAYGRLYIPAGSGMVYKIDAKKGEDGKNAVTLYWGYNDGADIYMNPVLPSEGYYWIDATLAAQTLIVRSTETSAETATVVAEGASAEDLLNLDITWFDEVNAGDNKLRFAPEAIVNQELQNNAEFKGKSIYVMANPKKNGLAFALLNQYKAKDESADPKEYRNLAKNSIYIVANVDPRTAADRLNIIWPEDVEEGATAIQSVKNASVNEGEIYNLQGVRVNAAYKGVVIKNGKKMIQK